MWIGNTYHEICATCECIVGHGCPQSEHCDCEEENAKE